MFPLVMKKIRRGGKRREKGRERSGREEAEASARRLNKQTESLQDGITLSEEIKVESGTM